MAVKNRTFAAIMMTVHIKMRPLVSRRILKEMGADGEL